MRHSSGPKLAETEVSGETGAPEIARQLEFEILFGGLRPRERLIEDALMHRFQATRHGVRQALAELERGGIVVRSPNRGATVRDFSATEVEEITELRGTLHRRAVERMRLPADPALVAGLKAVQRRHDKAVAAREPRAIDAANETFHRTLFAACGNKLLAEAIDHYAYLSRAMRLYPLVDRDLLQTLRAEHWSMIEALETGDRRGLMRVVVRHIQHSKNLYLAVRGRIA